MTEALTVGWCPGALRPMASGDGLILRVKPRGGAFTLAEAAAVAALSRRFGNGHLDLTSRANIQIRGAREETVEPLLAGLREMGLLDRDADSEARRNIVASPLAGLDPGCFDIRPFVSALEQGSEREAALQVLPAKWSFVVDGGGRLPLGGVSADMRFVFDRAGSMRIGLADILSRPLPANYDLPRLLIRLAALVGPAPARMAHILERLGVARTFAALDLTMADSQTLPSPHRGDPFTSGDGIAAFAPPFGNLPAEMLEAIVAACHAAGGIGLRLTPWRVVLATGIADGAACAADLAALGLIVRADDPRRGVTACVGAPACHRASAPTRTDAALIATRLGRDLDATIHLSGCAKGCGRPRGAGWSMVVRDGRYDISAGDEAVPRVTGLSSTDAANWLSRARRARIL